MGLKIEAPRFKRKNISATIVVDVKRFCRQIKTDEVFGTHTGPEFATDIRKEAGRWARLVKAAGFKADGE